MSEITPQYGNGETTPPTTRAQALSMIEPLNPERIASPESKRIAYARLLQFIHLILAE